MERGADINPEEHLVVAQGAVSIDPYREGAHRHRLRALALMGRRSDALTLYREIEQRLRRDLGVEPEAATREVLEAVRSGALPAHVGKTPNIGSRINRKTIARPQRVSRASPCCRSTRSEEHTSELQSLMRNSYAVFCLKTKKQRKKQVK